MYFSVKYKKPRKPKDFQKTQEKTQGLQTKPKNPRSERKTQDLGRKPGPPTVRGPDRGQNLFYLQDAKIRIQKKPKSVHSLSQKTPRAYLLHLYFCFLKH